MEGTGLALVELIADDLVSVVAAIERRETVTDLDLLWKREEEALLQIEATEPTLLAPVWDAGVPLRTPFEIRDRSTTWETTTSDDRLSALADCLDALGVEFEVRHVRAAGATEADYLLTDRQLEVLRAAATAGYYERPRTATLTEVAETLDIAKATCSDTLHRAEGKLVDWFIAEHATAGH